MPYTPLDHAALYSTAFRTGAIEWAVWTAILAAQDSDGNVAINPAFLAVQWSMDESEVQKAWDVHTHPDPKSKNIEHDGRRIIPLGDGRWHVVSFDKYKDRYRKEVRSEQLRLAKQKQRLREKLEREAKGLTEGGNGSAEEQEEDSE